MNVSVKETGAWERRLEIEIPADEVDRRIEEVARRYGYDRIPVRLPDGSAGNSIAADRPRRQDLARTALMVQPGSDGRSARAPVGRPAGAARVISASASALQVQRQQALQDVFMLPLR